MNFLEDLYLRILIKLLVLFNIIFIQLSIHHFLHPRMLLSSHVWPRHFGLRPWRNICQRTCQYILIAKQLVYDLFIVLPWNKGAPPRRLCVAKNIGQHFKVLHLKKCNTQVRKKLPSRQDVIAPSDLTINWAAQGHFNCFLMNAFRRVAELYPQSPDLLNKLAGFMCGQICKFFPELQYAGFHIQPLLTSLTVHVAELIFRGEAVASLLAKIYIAFLLYTYNGFIFVRR